MIKFLSLYLSLLFLASCVATGTVTEYSTKKISDKKIIAANISNGGPWMREIEKRLKEEGFIVLRSGSVNESIEVVSGTKMIIYNEASTRYYLEVDASAPTSQAYRCFGGGFNFDYIYADLIDVATNETIKSIEARGYSEDCPPLSGTIYGDIAKMVSSSFE